MEPMHRKGQSSDRCASDPLWATIGPITNAGKTLTSPARGCSP
jgi:hypothetical protein